METQRVQKIISNSGLMSRRKAEEYISSGRVKVNGKTISIGDKAKITDKIQVDGRVLKSAKRRYVMFHKPPNCLTTLKDPKGRRTIFDYIRQNDRLIPIGRLDFKTEGLLLLTNDGDFANKIMHPRYEVKKIYVIYLHKPLSVDDKQKIEQGVELEDGKTKQVYLRFLSENKDVVLVKIHEGKNRIVRRIFYHLGYKTKRLIRTKIGKLDLSDLKKGKYRELTKKEKEMFS